MPATKHRTETPDRLFRLLGDETRLRIIRGLLEAALTVNELTRVLRVPQSTISRHLGVMRAGSLAADRREGTRVFYSLADALLRDRALMALIEGSMGRLAHGPADRRRLEKVLEARRRRTRDFFDSVAGGYRAIAEPGGGAEGLLSAAILALPASTVVDIGCGEGDIAVRFARLGHRVHAVDSSRKMITALKARLKREGLRGVKVHTGDIESLPLPDACGDVVLLSQILHHAPRPEAALREAARVAKPGGRVVVLDLLRHGQEWTREKMGDLWLGFEPAEVKGWMTDAGLESVRHDTVEVDEGLPLVVCGGVRTRN